MTHLTESILKEAVIEYLAGQYFRFRYGIEIAPGEPATYR
jgi:hypothetical protein